MKAYPEEGWDEQPFTARLTLENGETITLVGVTIKTIDSRAASALRRYDPNNPNAQALD